MLYISAEDFFHRASLAKRLTEEEKRECALRMKEGDASARQMLIDSHLFQVASCAKRWAYGGPSLEIIYRFLRILENEVGEFDFQKNAGSFQRILEWKFRQEMSRHILDEDKLK